MSNELTQISEIVFESFYLKIYVDFMTGEYKNANSKIPEGRNTCENITCA